MVVKYLATAPTPASAATPTPASAATPTPASATTPTATVPIARTCQQARSDKRESEQPRLLPINENRRTEQGEGGNQTGRLQLKPRCDRCMRATEWTGTSPYNCVKCLYM